MTIYNKKVWALIPAGGIGSRMPGAIPKQYRCIHGKPILHYTLELICQVPQVVGVILGIQHDDKFWAENSYTDEKFLSCYSAGTCRVETVINGIKYLFENSDCNAKDWLLVHDAVRPCVPLSDIQNLIQTGVKSGIGGVLGSQISSTLKKVDDSNMIQKTVNRAGCWIAHTPQIFNIGKIHTALEQAIRQGVDVTDESMAMELLGAYPIMVEGSLKNIKITTSDDFELASYYLKSKQNNAL